MSLNIFEDLHLLTINLHYNTKNIFRQGDLQIILTTNVLTKASFLYKTKSSELLNHNIIMCCKFD